jgi:hypothetical protein
MEQKNRGTYKVNPNKTPKENVVALLAMVAPMDTTLAKMTGTLEVKDETAPYWRRRADTLRLNEVNAFPSSRNRWSECTEIKDFQRVVFNTKTARSVNYRRDIMRSVPVVKGKISLTKVTRLLTEFAKLNQDFVNEQEREKIEQAKREAIRKENEKKLTDLRNSVKLPKFVDLGYAGHRYDEVNMRYDIDIRGLKEEQVVAIAIAINEALKKNKVEEAVEADEDAE